MSGGSHAEEYTPLVENGSRTEQGFWTKLLGASRASTLAAGGMVGIVFVASFSFGLFAAPSALAGAIAAGVIAPVMLRNFYKSWTQPSLPSNYEGEGEDRRDAYQVMDDLLMKSAHTPTEAALLAAGASTRNLTDGDHPVEIKSNSFLAHLRDNKIITEQDAIIIANPNEIMKNKKAVYDKIHYHFKTWIGMGLDGLSTTSADLAIPFFMILLGYSIGGIKEFGDLIGVDDTATDDHSWGVLDYVGTGLNSAAGLLGISSVISDARAETPIETELAEINRKAAEFEDTGETVGWCRATGRLFGVCG